jgi:hypothetical protein
MYFTSFLPVISLVLLSSNKKSLCPATCQAKTFCNTIAAAQYWEGCLSTESLHLGRILSLIFMKHRLSPVEENFFNCHQPRDYTTGRAICSRFVVLALG